MTEALNVTALTRESQWRRRLLQPMLRQRSAMVGLAIIAIYIFAAVFAPWLATHDPTAQDLMASLQGPSAAHWLGTDSYGQDLYSRLLYGAQLALIIGFASVALGLAVGVAIGLAAGLMGGRTEWVLMRIVDGLLAFPELILAMAFMAVLGLGTENVVYALALSFVGPFARMTRGDVLQVKSQPYIEAARMMGVPTAAIIWRHVLPNVVSPILVQAGMRISIAILLESGLSFLGIGVVPPTPDWGLMIAEGRGFITMAPWISGVPGVALAILLVALNLLGDGLRDAFDPTTQKDA
ncbi:MAG: ABC transporter permease [Thiobacillus sp.]|jgi:ABC-type dipeptide/oligopeptide/nickel transport system permease subunit|nr:ABC transporter permease [Gammaproteobacteria bacterium]OYZ28086.1 MAG: peptide ABC transporter permease [Hydrogenophilales bacterium 16-64-40]OZA34581.1 MAG: peptide ABC transporter permease [Hydrogenophilales bacterium 17-64-65]HQT33617.1 ABC transporter permease [Thiobacillus sp.]